MRRLRHRVRLLSRRAARGRAVAELLRESWRPNPPPHEPPPERLAEIRTGLLRTGAGGLAWHRLSRGALRDVPEVVELRDVSRMNALHLAIREREILTALAALRGAGVEPLLGKGWAVARLYPGPGLRPPGDVDLYVPAAQHAAARAALHDAEAHTGPIDLHGGFSDLDDREESEITARSRCATLEGTPVRCFGPEDHLRLLGLHMLRHGAARPLWLCDVALLLETRPDDFDWDWFLSGDPRRTQGACCTIALAGELLGARLDGVPPAALPETLPGWVVPTLLRAWGSGYARREPISAFRNRPLQLWGELLRHWPNGLEATAAMGAAFDGAPRLPLQIAFSAKRAARFASPGAARATAPGTDPPDPA